MEAGEKLDKQIILINPLLKDVQSSSNVMSVRLENSRIPSFKSYNAPETFLSVFLLRCGASLSIAQAEMVNVGKLTKAERCNTAPRRCIAVRLLQASEYTVHIDCDKYSCSQIEVDKLHALMYRRHSRYCLAIEDPE